MKITFVGAGSRIFCKNVLTDILALPNLRKNTMIALHDINEQRLEHIFEEMELYKQDHVDKLANVEFTKTTDLRDAIEDAKYVIDAIMVGGPESLKLDIDIPIKYGIDQCIGDTTSVGAVFRALRTFPVLAEIIKTMQDIGYNAGQKNCARPLLLNYANPMAMNTWYCNALWPGSTVGLCHGVQGTFKQLHTTQIGASAEECSFLCAGINHMAWFTELWFRDGTQKDAKWQDAYPIIWEHYKDEPEIVYDEKVRWDMMKATGYYMTESSGHLSEYVPYYRKRQDLIEKYKGNTNGFNNLQHGWDLQFYGANSDAVDAEARLKPQSMRFKDAPSEEYASHIINAMETDQPFRFNGNVMNIKGGLITNVPADCCVEVPVFADSHGIHPQGGIELPTVCAALCTSNIMVHKATIDGALAHDKEKIYQAVLLDPLSAAVCSPEEIRQMVDEMFDAEKQWLAWF
ncbi:MAG TPA: alpha-glucosidase/alpha-galactosidase [Candidatus Lokiarchaeia archaeon]|nr:alpha-glucosidase/alpha-galactosidase [Candidatus Lokiarchaeia archaeon]